MTDRFKEALDWFKYRYDDFKQEVESGNRGAKGWEKTWSHIQTTIEALTLATESEQLQTKLSETVIHLAARNTEIEQLRKEWDEWQLKYNALLRVFGTVSDELEEKVSEQNANNS